MKPGDPDKDPGSSMNKSGADREAIPPGGWGSRDNSTAHHPTIQALKDQTHTGIADGSHANLHHYTPANTEVKHSDM